MIELELIAGDTKQYWNVFRKEHRIAKVAFQAGSWRIALVNRASSKPGDWRGDFTTREEALSAVEWFLSVRDASELCG